MSIDNLIISAQLQTDKFDKGISKITGSLSGLGKTIFDSTLKVKTLEKGFDAVVGSIKQGFNAVIGNTIDYLKQTWEHIDNVAESAQKLNISVESFQKLTFAAGQLNTQTEDVVSGLEKLQIHLGEGSPELINTLKQLGLSYTDLLASSPDEAFVATLSSLKDLDNTFQRSAIFKTLYGKSGNKLNNLVDNGLLDQLSNAPVIDEETAKKIDTANDAYARLNMSTQRVAGLFVGELAEGITAFINTLDEFISSIDGRDIKLLGEITTYLATIFVQMGIAAGQLVERLFYLGSKLGGSASIALVGAGQPITAGVVGAGAALGNKAYNQEVEKNGFFWDKIQGKLMSAQERLLDEINNPTVKGNNGTPKRQDPYALFEGTLKEQHTAAEEKYKNNILSEQRLITANTSRLLLLDKELELNNKITDQEKQQRRDKLTELALLSSEIYFKEKAVSINEEGLKHRMDMAKIDAQLAAKDKFNENVYKHQKDRNDIISDPNILDGDKAGLLYENMLARRAAERLQQKEKELEGSKMLWKMEEQTTILTTQRAKGITLTTRELEIQKQIENGISDTLAQQLKTQDRLLTIEERKARIKSKSQLGIFDAVDAAMGIKKQFDPSIELLEQKKKIDALFNNGLITENERAGALSQSFNSLIPEKQNGSLVRKNSQEAWRLMLKNENGRSDADTLKEIERIEKEQAKKHDETNRLLNEWLVRQKEEIISIER